MGNHSARRTVEGLSRSKAGRRCGVAVQSPIGCVPSRWTMGAMPVDRPQAYYTPNRSRVGRYSASRALFVCRRPAPRLLQGCRALRSPEPRQQTHFRSLGGSLRAPRLSSPWREPEGKISFAITTDDLMNTDRIESVASKLTIKLNGDTCDLWGNPHSALLLWFSFPKLARVYRVSAAPPHWLSAP